ALGRQFIDLYSQLGGANEAILARVGSMTFADIVRALRRTEAEFIERAGANKEIAREIRRRAAECTLIAAILKDCPFQVCKRAFQAVHRLSFTDLEIKTSIYVVYARACSWKGHWGEGIRLLEGIAKEFEDLVDRNRSPTYKKAATRLQDIVEELRWEQSQSN